MGRKIKRDRRDRDDDDDVPSVPADPVVVVPPPYVPPPVTPPPAPGGFTAALKIGALTFDGIAAPTFVDGAGVQHTQVKSGQALYVDRDWAAWGFDFSVADPKGLDNSGKIELRIASDDGEVALLQMMQAPEGWVGDQPLTYAGAPGPVDPAQFIWTGNAGWIDDKDGFDANATSGWLNIGQLFDGFFGADYRNAGENYDIAILQNDVVVAHVVADLI